MSRSERPFVLTAPQRQTLGAACMCAAATLLVILPAVLHGFPAGHDTNFHATAWFDVIDHWKEGILFPSWGARFARGLGQPVYTFYPPLSLLLGSALTVIFGAAAAPTIFTWICVATGGFGTYLLARRFLPYPAAVIAAVLYIASPYIAMDAYDRNAFAELVALAAFPYALWSFYSMREKRSHVLRLALSMMVIALTNLPSTIVCGSALIFLSIIVSFRDKTVRPFLTVVGANVLAALWAAFFLLPAALQRQWVLSGEATSGQWDYAIHFPTATLTHFFEHNFYRETHLVVMIYVAVLLIVGIASALRTNVQRPRFVVEFWITSAVSALLMFSLSAKFYSLVRIMKYIQFPWRYLLVLSTTLAVVTSSLASLRRARYTILVVASLLALGWYAFWPPQFFHDRTAIWDESFNIRTREIPGIREYMPSTVPMGAVERNALEPPVVAVPKSPDTQFRITRWDTEDRRILFQVSQPSVLLVRIIDFPGWNATINGAPAQTSVDASSGLIRVPVDGTGLLQLRFTRRASSTVGAAISVLSIFLALLWRRRFATGLQHPN